MTLFIQYSTLPTRLQHALMGSDIFTLNDLAQKTEKELLKIPNISHWSVGQIKQLLAAHGLALKEECRR